MAKGKAELYQNKGLIGAYKSVGIGDGKGNAKDHALPLKDFKPKKGEEGFVHVVCVNHDVLPGTMTPAHQPWLDLFDPIMWERQVLQIAQRFTVLQVAHLPEGARTFEDLSAQRQGVLDKDRGYEDKK